MTQDKEIFTTEEPSGFTAVSCNAGTNTDRTKGEITAHVLPENGGYRVVATLNQPNTGSIDLLSNKVYIFRDQQNPNELENEVIRVRELVFTYSGDGNDLTGEVMIPQDEIEDEEIITVIVTSLTDVLPRKPKVSIIRPGGPTTPSSVSGR